MKNVIEIINRMDKLMPLVLWGTSIGFVFVGFIISLDVVIGDYCSK